jgi:hypothetical protein
MALHKSFGLGFDTCFGEPLPIIEEKWFWHLFLVAKG